MNQIWPSLHDVFTQKRRNLRRGTEIQPSTPSPLRRKVLRSRFNRAGLNIESLYCSSKTVQQQTTTTNESTQDGSNTTDQQEGAGGK
ncbi:unnamed protein product [Didymodactylos carnosus]|uniref:Uncharacterized protein n=1 Tax=Didymodactylos carnosus TaxID=1234261 RepID=A0A815RJS3_9BILA|nr:unnamed protein product [Didymodactylos carnosus]CAF4343957.1 unnamed protein product [Didymodactylos carnosus]